jgi:hypothetical protein
MESDKPCVVCDLPADFSVPRAAGDRISCCCHCARFLAGKACLVAAEADYRVQPRTVEARTASEDEAARIQAMSLRVLGCFSPALLVEPLFLSALTYLLVCTAKAHGMTAADMSQAVIAMAEDETLN